MGVIDLPARQFIDPICSSLGLPLQWPEDHPEQPDMVSPLDMPGLPNVLYATLKATLAGLNYQLNAIMDLPKLPAPPGPPMFIDPFLAVFKVPFIPEFPAIPSSSPLIKLSADAPIASPYIFVDTMLGIPSYPFLATLDSENIKIVSGDLNLKKLVLYSPTEILHLTGTVLKLAASISMPAVPTLTTPAPPFINLDDFIKVVTQYIKFIFAMNYFPISFIMGLLSQLPVITLPTLDTCIEIVASGFKGAGLTTPEGDLLPAVKNLATSMGTTVFNVILGIVPLP